VNRGAFQREKSAICDITRCVCTWVQGGHTSRALQRHSWHVCECTVVGVLATNAIHTEASECSKDGGNRTVRFGASCDKLLGGVMLRTLICTYCPKGTFSVCV